MKFWSTAADLIYGSSSLVAVAQATTQTHEKLGWRWYMAYLMAINAVAFSYYAFDKALSTVFKKGFKLRVPEKILIWWLAFPGGIAGAWFGMEIFRHKTKKQPFRVRWFKSLYVMVATCATLLLAVREGILSPEQLDMAIGTLAGLVLKIAQWLLT